jgi:hypothetical protein
VQFRFQPFEVGEQADQLSGSLNFHNVQPRGQRDFFGSNVTGLLLGAKQRQAGYDTRAGPNVLIKDVIPLSRQDADWKSPRELLRVGPHGP